MKLLAPPPKSPLRLRLGRDLVRTLKRGHPWVYAEALRQRPAAPPGTVAILLDNKKGREVAQGYYDPHSPLAFRACTVERGVRPDEAWAEQRLACAVGLRQGLFDQSTTAYRLFNGEGDGLPGLICDIYADTAVIQLDGAGPSGFWYAPGIAEWVAARLKLKRVYQRPQSRSENQGQALIGEAPTELVAFLENGVRFSADLIQGQKTGFFLDQRDNRVLMRGWAQGRRVLNLFAYTGGFSIYAGLGGASQVTTVDLAGPALTLAERHWQQNGLDLTQHETIKADAFKFLEKAAKQDRHWGLVILDPPSFASSKTTLPQALTAYQTLIAGGATVTEREGLLAAASCSSHVGLEAFLQACEGGVAQARRRATLLGIYGQPADHPTPLAFPEFRYLKFVLMRVE